MKKTLRFATWAGGLIVFLSCAGLMFAQTPTPVGYKTPTPTATPSATPTPTATPTAAPTLTPAKTPSPEPTLTPEPSASPTATPTASPSPSPISYQVTGAGSAAMNGVYCPEGTYNGCWYYNSRAAANYQLRYEPALGKWSLCNLGVPQYTITAAGSPCETLLTGTWDVAAGDAPAPVVTEAACAPSPTPSPSVTPTPTPSPTPSVTPTAEPTATPSPSPSTSPTPEPSPSPSPTLTPSPTASPSPTKTPTPSPSPTASPSPSPSPIAIGAVTYGWSLQTAQHEYYLDLGQGIKAFSVQARGSYDAHLSFAPYGTSGTHYWTVKSGDKYVSPPINHYITLYGWTAQTAATLEIEYWR